MTRKNDKKPKKYIGGKEDKPDAEAEATIEEPTLKDNLEKAGVIGLQAANNQVATALNNAAMSLNIDPNASTTVILEQVNDRLKNINEAFQSPEGKQILSELGELSSNLAKTATEPLREGQRVFNEMLMEQLRSFEKLAWGAVGLVPVVGDVSELVRIARDLFQVFTRVMGAASGVSTNALNTLTNIQNTIGQSTNLFSKMASLIKNTLAQGNRQVNKVLTTASEDVKDQGKSIVQEEKEISKKIKKAEKEQKGGARIRKRTHKSIDKFLSTKINSSHMKRKYSVKRRTRKHRKPRKY